MSDPAETAAPFKVSKDRVLSMPLALLISLLAVAAVGYAKWMSTEEKVERHSSQITGLENEARTTREILIRIDENVKDLRRERRNTP